MPDFRWDDRRFQKAVLEAPGRLFREARTRLLRFLRLFVRKDIARDRLSGNPLKVRTGGLRRSFDAEATGSDLASLAVRAFSTSPYAGIHETGGVIRPKSRSYLSIPLDAATTPAGVKRAALPSYPNTFLIPSGSGFVVMDASGAQPVPIFLLTKSVKIPARLGFADAWKRRQGEVPRIIAQAVEAALDERGAA